MCRHVCLCWFLRRRFCNSLFCRLTVGHYNTWIFSLILSLESSSILFYLDDELTKEYQYVMYACNYAYDNTEHRVVSQAQLYFTFMVTQTYQLARFWHKESIDFFHFGVVNEACLNFKKIARISHLKGLRYPRIYLKIRSNRKRKANTISVTRSRI